MEALHERHATTQFIHHGDGRTKEAQERRAEKLGDFILACKDEGCLRLSDKEPPAEACAKPRQRVKHTFEDRTCD